MDQGDAADQSSGLLERSGHLHALDEAFAAVRADGSGRLVLIGGEAGVGKTVLLQRFRDECGEPARVLWGGCDPLTTPGPLGPLFDVAKATGGELAELVSSAARPHEVATTLIEELNRPQQRRTAVLVLEDVHWADEATLDVLRLLGRRLERARALVAVSYRDDELDPAHPLRLVLGELAGAAGVSHLDVERLSTTAVAALAEPHGIDGADLHRLTAGNPFFVAEALAGGGEEIPRTIRDAVLARAGRLSPRARRVLGAVSVSPAGTEVWLLEALAGEEIDCLEECLASGMLTQSATGVAFRHELGRRAVEAAVSPDRRVALHRAALEVLAKPPGGAPEPARLAHHAEAIADAEAVLRYAPAAAEHAASLGAHREAAAHYERALRFAGGVPTEARAQLLERRAQECHVIDSPDAAIEAAEQAIGCARELGDRRLEGGLLVQLAMILWSAGLVEEAHEAGAQALTELDEHDPSRELALTYSIAAALCMDADETDGAVAWAARTVELCEQLGEVEPMANALIYSGTADLLAGRAEGIAEIEQAIELATGAGLEDRIGNAYTNIAMATTRVRAYELGQQHLLAGLEYCSEHGLESDRRHLLAYRARLELDQGHWAEAEESAALVLRQQSASALLRILPLTVQGLVRARRGDADARRPLEEALDLAGPTLTIQHLAPVAVARAEAAWLKGNSEDVAEITEPAWRLALDARSAWVIGELACWRRRAGIAEDVPSPAEPYALQLAGDWQAAAAHWDRLGCPYEAALARADGDDEQAHRLALAALQQLGGRAAAQLVARHLREGGAKGLPRGPRRKTTDNPAGLTARELEVLGLVAQGMRNAEIAERLFLSEKTVDHHVSAILRKLGARNRSQAASEATRLGIVTQAE